ncbi:putative membrane protein [Leptospira ryugenii]|uniref:Putative membrane protein n=1 Tax=Leptospira ryugenii TaxID=1917863 RepID=A0A2P2E062_9LEPT|nr:Gldg family protein [Leptospira ryugenii]GBF50274.1 putative membrane protein [Leptospira ryugenii]
MFQLERIFPFIGVIALFQFFLFDGMIVEPSKRLVWLSLVPIFILSDVIYRVFAKGIQKQEVNRYLGALIGVLSFALYVLRDWIDIPVVSGVNPEVGYLSRLREILLLLIILFAFAYLLQVVLLEIGKSSLEAQTSLSFSKNTLLQNALLGFLILLPILVAINYFAIKRNYNFDLSSKGKFSLSPIARNLLKQIKKETNIIAFYPRPLEADGDSNTYALTRVRTDVEIFLDQIRAENPLVTVQFINAYVETDLAKDYPSAANGTILIRSKKELLSEAKTPYAEEKISIKEPGDLVEMERKIISALFTVTTEQKKIYFTVSNGERFGLSFRSVPNEQINRFTTNLRFLNFKVEEWGFSQGWPSQLPSDADMVAIIGPSIPFSPEAREAIQKYVLENNGKLFITIDPRGKESFDWLLSISGLKFSETPLIELVEKPGVVVAKRIQDHNLTQFLSNKDQGVLFPFSGAFQSVSAGKNPFLFKSENLLESGFDVFADSNQNKKMDGAEKKENFIFSTLLTPLSLTGDKKGRIVIHSGTSWLTDQFYLYTSNAAFSTSLVTGQFLDEAITEIPAKKDEASVVNLSDNQKLVVWALGVFIYPGLILLVGSYYVLSKRKSKSYA